MKRKHQKTLEQLFARPTSGSIRWSDIEALFISLGAEISEREGSRIGVRLFGERRVFHRPVSPTGHILLQIQIKELWQASANGLKKTR